MIKLSNSFLDMPLTKEEIKKFGNTISIRHMKNVKYHAIKYIQKVGIAKARNYDKYIIKHNPTVNTTLQVYSLYVTDHYKE